MLLISAVNTCPPQFGSNKTDLLFSTGLGMLVNIVNQLKEAWRNPLTKKKVHKILSFEPNLLSVCPGRHIWCQSNLSPAGWDGGRWGQTGTDPWHPAEKTKNGESSHTETLCSRTPRRAGTWNTHSSSVLMLTWSQPISRQHQSKIIDKAHSNPDTATHQKLRPVRSPNGNQENEIKKSILIFHSPQERHVRAIKYSCEGSSHL